jgi:hypothetical protein
MTQLEKDYVSIGNHLVRVEDDSVFMLCRGMLIESELIELYSIFAEVRKAHAMVFVLYDGRLLTGMDPKARKMSAMTNKPELKLDLQVSFGASFAVRVIAGLILRAAALLGRDSPPVYLFEKEADARVFFRSERARIRAQLGRVSIPSPPPS